MLPAASEGPMTAAKRKHKPRIKLMVRLEVWVEPLWLAEALALAGYGHADADGKEALAVKVDRGFGFIVSDYGERIFFHASTLKLAHIPQSRIREGDRVSFTVARSKSDHRLGAHRMVLLRDGDRPLQIERKL
jgi:cold shock CspA family protein